MSKVSELLYEVDTKQLRVPRFQRGWVWQKKQVRQLFRTLYRGHPVGSLIEWPTKLDDGTPVNDIIDGQQRLTALYGIIRGKTPPWFNDSSDSALHNLMFNVATQEFEYETRQRLDDPLWIHVASLFCENGHESWSDKYKSRSGDEASGTYHRRVARLINILDRQVNVEKLPENVSVEEAAELFDLVNRAGKRVTEGDLVIGQISLKWEDARENLESALDEWRSGGFSISLEWLLHAMSASIGDTIDFDFVRYASRDTLVAHFKTVYFNTSEVLNNVRDILGLDSTMTTSVNNGLIVLVMSKIKTNRLSFDSNEQMRPLVGWWLLGTLHSRWSADVKNRTNKDLTILLSDSGVDGLIRELETKVQLLAIANSEFSRNHSSKPYYRLMQVLTRRRGARDLRSGVSLSFDQFGPNARLEAHHIFPRACLTTANIKAEMIDQLANLALIPKGSNLRIGSKSPADYLPEFEAANPGVLESQWIPKEPRLWTVDAYSEFLEKRRKFLAMATDELMRDLLGHELWPVASA